MLPDTDDAVLSGVEHLANLQWRWVCAPSCVTWLMIGQTERCLVLQTGLCTALAGMWESLQQCRWQVTVLMHDRPQAKLSVLIPGSTLDP
jgi:hypothetical protein